MYRYGREEQVRWEVGNFPTSGMMHYNLPWPEYCRTLPEVEFYCKKTAARVEKAEVLYRRVY